MNKTILALVCVLAATALAVVSIYRYTHHNRPPMPDLDPYSLVGEIAAEETSALLHQRGRIVFVTADPSLVVFQAEQEAFRRGIAKFPGVSIAAEEQVPTDRELRLSPGTWATVLQKYPDVDAIVSVYGFAGFTDAELRQLPDRLPKMIGLFGPSAGAEQLFARGADGFAIVATSMPVPGEKHRNARELFDRHFRIIRPASH
jgi:hypothetical protein